MYRAGVELWLGYSLAETRSAGGSSLSLFNNTKWVLRISHAMVQLLRNFITRICDFFKNKSLSTNAVQGIVL